MVLFGREVSSWRVRPPCSQSDLRQPSCAPSNAADAIAHVCQRKDPKPLIIMLLLCATTGQLHLVIIIKGENKVRGIWRHGDTLEALVRKKKKKKEAQ